MDMKSNSYVLNTYIEVGYCLNAFYYICTISYIEKEEDFGYG